MAFLRRIAASVGAAAIISVGFASAASAEVPVPGVGGLLGDLPLVGGLGEDAKEQRVAPEDNKDLRWYGVKKSGGLVEITDNNLGPFQVCNNDVPINAVGRAGVVSGLVGILPDDNSGEIVRGCYQESTQDN